MKLFSFEYDGYGTSAHVMAETIEEANAAILADAINQDEESYARYPSSVMRHYNEYMARNMIAEKDGYKTVVLGPGEVIWTEVS